MGKLKVGVVGLGWAAGGHIIAFNENADCEVAALCSRKKLSKDEIVSLFGCEATLYNDYDAFLAHPGLDIVDICTPHPMHPEQTIKAARAGKHVMIEKPLSLDYRSLLAMRDAIAEARVRSTAYFELRFIPQFDLVQSCIRQGLLGDLHHIEVDYYHGIGPWYGQYAWNIKKDMGGSALLTAGCHALDALMYFRAGEVEEVYAYSTKSTSPIMQAYEYDTTSVAILKFTNGTTGKCVSCIDCRQPYVFNIKLVGSEGTYWNNRLWSTKLNGLRPQEWVDMPTTSAESGDVLSHPYPAQVNHFIECLRNGERGIIDFEEAFKTHRVAFAIEKSLEEERPVKLAELAF